MSDELPAETDPLRVGAALAAVAGIIHIKAAIDHAGHWWAFGAFFGILACGQLAWALVIERGRRDRWLLDAAIYVSLAVAAIWLLSRTAGLPFGPWAWDAERVGVGDMVATLDELVLAALLTAVRRPDGRAGRAFGWMRGGHALRIGVMLSSASVLALAFGGHSHH